MKRHHGFIQLFSGIIFLTMQAAQAQIVITKSELPLAIGTSWITINDTTESVQVDVGNAGENQHWEFHEEISGLEIRQEIVERDSTPFRDEFPNSNYVMKYDGGLLDMIYSDVFPQIKGDVYFYQLVTDSTVELQGTGFRSSFLTGAAHFQPPNVILNFLPTQYLDEWITKSVFSISKDTTIVGISGEFKLTVNDSAYSIIDAWGTISTPMGVFDCLRMKSYVTMNEQVLFNNIPVTTKKARVINYNWLAPEYGIVMRVASHTNEPDDHFSDARLYSRMVDFVPGTKTRLDKHLPVPLNARLYPNYPNPFNPETSIRFDLKRREKVWLSIYNLAGQRVAILMNGDYQSPGHHTVSWRATDGRGNPLPSGTYLARLSSPSVVQTQKMTLIK